MGQEGGGQPVTVPQNPPQGPPPVDPYQEITITIPGYTPNPVDYKPPKEDENPTLFRTVADWYSDLSLPAQIAGGVVLVVGTVLLIRFSGLAGEGVNTVVHLAATGAGTATGAGLNAVLQHLNNGHIDSGEVVLAGIMGGMSGAFGVTSLGARQQMIFNSIVAFTGSVVGGDTLQEIIINTILAGASGYIGGRGVGFGGNYTSEALRVRELLPIAIRTIAMATGVTSSFDIGRTIFNLITEAWRSRNDSCE